MRTLQLSVASVLCAVLVGCADGGAVSGKVTLDGLALHTGTVYFHAETGDTLAKGEIAPDGGFTLAIHKRLAIPAGEYIATVVAAEGNRLGQGNRPPEQPKLITPEHYGDKKRSGLTYVVKPGANHFDISLVSKAKE
jgi:hypothetical protein